MLIHRHSLRVRYSETDRMGYVYYGRYAEYFEVARAEMVRSLGVCYREMEDLHGVMLPVVEMQIRYRKPARYDDLLTIQTRVKQMPAVRMAFEHEALNEKGELLLEARVELVFVRRDTMKPCRAPAYFLEAIEKFWQTPD